MKRIQLGEREYSWDKENTVGRKRIQLGQREYSWDKENTDETKRIQLGQREYSLDQENNSWDQENTAWTKKIQLGPREYSWDQEKTVGTKKIQLGPRENSWDQENTVVIAELCACILALDCHSEKMAESIVILTSYLFMQLIDRNVSLSKSTILKYVIINCNHVHTYFPSKFLI